MKRRMKYDRHGFLAIDPKCFGLDFMFFEPAVSDPFDVVGETAIVKIEGPLSHHPDWWSDSYDGILERVQAACASECKNILMVIDSPGGDASGCFDTSRALTDLAASAGKKLYAYVDGCACSGGYALACAAEKIYVSDTSFVGSIGVIAQMVDASKLDAMMGLRWSLITSGARKADGNPHQPTNDGAIKAMQNSVDSLAMLFFDLVSTRRPGLSSGDVQALEAASMAGFEAVARGLADVVTTRASLLADLSIGNEHNGPSAAKEKTAMGWKEEMKKAAEDGDEEAKEALAALEPEEDEEKKEKSEGEEDEKKTEGEEPDGDEKKKKEDDDKKTESEEKKDAKKAASSRGASFGVEALQRIGVLEREAEQFKAQREEEERSSLLGAHDLTSGQIKLMRSLPIDVMKKTLAEFGASKSPVKPAAASRVNATRGLPNGGTRSNVSQSVSDDVDRKMGLGRSNEVPHWEGRDFVIPGITMSQATAKDILARNQKEGRGVR